MKKLFKKKFFIAFCVVIVIAAGVLGGIKLHRVKEARQSGILLAFDDYSPDTWSAHFDLFDEYGVKVTFFVTLPEPTDFCFEAIKRGHEIGFHTVSHRNVTEISEDQFRAETIDPIEIFREKGIELTSFAYPLGARNEDADEILLQHYKIVRGAYHYDLRSKADFRHGFVDAFPLDNYYYDVDDDEAFEQVIDGIMEELSRNVGAVAVIYSHTIDDGAAWGIPERRLRYIFEKADEYGLKFYTFQDLQKD